MTRAGLFEETLKAHALIPEAELRVDESIIVSVQEQAAASTAKHILVGLMRVDLFHRVVRSGQS